MKQVLILFLLQSYLAVSEEIKINERKIPKGQIYVEGGRKKCFLFLFFFTIFQHFSSSLCFYFSSFVLLCNFYFLINHWFLLLPFLLFWNTFMLFFFLEASPRLLFISLENSVPFYLIVYSFMHPTYISVLVHLLYFFGGVDFWLVGFFPIIDFMSFNEEGYFSPTFYDVSVLLFSQNLNSSKCPTWFLNPGIIDRRFRYALSGN